MIRASDRRRPRPELVVAAALMAWALAPIVLMIIHAAVHHERLTGADGIVGGDQLQYLAWVRDAGSHVLASNLFDAVPSAHVFAQPLFTISGLLWWIGLPLPAAYWLWKPVAVLVLVGGAVCWTRRMAGESRGRFAAALVLALCLYTPVAALVDWTSTGSLSSRANVGVLAGEIFPAGELWGYLPSAMAVGLMPIVLLGCERALDALSGRQRSRRALVVATSAAALVSWLHPWQGVTLLLIFAGLGAWGGWAHIRVLLAPALGALAPLLYYELLSRLDSAWKLASHNEHVGRLPAGALALGLVPLLAIAAPGLRRPRTDVAERALLLWLPASLIAYFALSAFSSHALEGISLPIAVLAVRGWGRLRLPAAIGAIALALLTLPGMAYEARTFRNLARGPLQQYYLTASDARALDWISQRAPAGPVLARTLFAVGVPSQTNRAVWVGHKFWSRDFISRYRAADALFAGALAPAQAQAVVALSGVRLVMADCGARARLDAPLRPLIQAIRRFGCATVYVVRRV